MPYPFNPVLHGVFNLRNLHRGGGDKNALYLTLIPNVLGAPSLHASWR